MQIDLPDDLVRAIDDRRLKGETLNEAVTRVLRVKLHALAQKKRARAVAYSPSVTTKFSPQELAVLRAIEIVYDTESLQQAIRVAVRLADYSFEGKLSEVSDGGL